MVRYGDMSTTTSKERGKNRQFESVRILRKDLKEVRDSMPGFTMAAAFSSLVRGWRQLSASERAKAIGIDTNVSGGAG